MKKRRAGAASCRSAPGGSSLSAVRRCASVCAISWVVQRSALSFGYGEHGKPFAKDQWPARAVIGFNVSHSGRHGLIAIAAHDGIGVDVEERVAQRDLEGIGSLVYGPAERALLAAAAGREKVHLFYRLWSMKEALDQSRRHRLFSKPIAVRNPGGDAAWRPIGFVSLPARAGERMAAPGPGRAPLRRRVGLGLQGAVSEQRLVAQRIAGFDGFAPLVELHQVGDLHQRE